MGILSPVSLLWLIPWAGLALWMLWGRRPRRHVPFLELWKGPIPPKAARKSIQLPPLSIILALLAVLLAVAAAAHPYLRRRGASDESVTLIIDRGLTMSARGRHDLRFREALQEISSLAKPHSVDLLAVPGEERRRVDWADCLRTVAEMQPSAVDTRQLLKDPVDWALNQSKGLVLVVTDQPIAGQVDRVIVIPPDGRLEDVAITLISAREHPAGQVMVRVRNESDLPRTTLKLSSENNSSEKQIELPPRGQERDYFVDLPHLGQTVSAALVVNDDQPLDDRAWLVRQGSWPQIEPRIALSEELRRMIDSYQRVRPASDASIRLPMIDDPAQLPGSGAAVLLPKSQGETTSGPIQASAHPLTANVDWAHLPQPLHVDGEAPTGWTPILRIAGRTIAAVAPDGLRQVWIGFNAPNWPRSPDYVIFWTNVFDWAGGGGEAFVSRSINQWSQEWHPTDGPSQDAGLAPGIYRRSDGVLMAFNAPAVPVFRPASSDWRQRLTEFQAKVGRQDLSGFLLLAALSCLVFSIALWKRPAKAAQSAEVHTADAAQVPS